MAIRMAGAILMGMFFNPGLARKKKKAGNGPSGPATISCWPEDFIYPETAQTTEQSLGDQFTFLADMTIVALRIFVSSGEAPLPIGHQIKLWEKSSSAMIQTASAITELAYGWNTIDLLTPVPRLAGTGIVVGTNRNLSTKPYASGAAKPPNTNPDKIQYDGSRYYNGLNGYPNSPPSINGTFGTDFVATI